MANEEHVKILEQGVKVWNQWRQQHPEIQPDLSEAQLGGMDLMNANLSGANLSKTSLTTSILADADLRGAIMCRAELIQAALWAANLSRADLREASLFCAELRQADLSYADLRGANLCEVNLRWANLSGANLSGAELTSATLVAANFSGANLSGCTVYGISAWDMQLKDAIQTNLIITLPNEPAITVDNLEVAQFIHLLLNNERIRHVIDTITSKVVLILGRFTSGHKQVLDMLREELRKYDYLPVLFDFEKPAGRDLTETVSTLAHLARFIIADLTEPNSIPHEVATIIPQCKVPLQPLLVQGDSVHEYPMFRDLRLYPWVLPTVRYQDTPSLLAALQVQVIEPAERKAKELAKLKAEE